METWDAIRSRRDVRQFSERPIADAHLERVLDAGRRAPSAGNLQPWDFVVVRDRDQLQALAGVWQGAGHVAGAQAVIALVSSVPGDEMQRSILAFDLGQATMVMALAAADLGIASAHSAVEDQAKAQGVLAFPDGKFLAFMLSVGYPAGRPLAVIDRPDRRPYADVVHQGRW
ncbi:nitroreductase [Humibacillus xanthopallidus]|uniref:Nitroreductase n=1 Tax=Humibacillus xanthopallidus TaxID=412689 RepID=A0A543PSI1_9MICO|nr:nitroreductase family protein [Humibacillus xanthopallidus]TQN47047.1 nitroreductase [Humibacillus xanthopallidus]